MTLLRYPRGLPPSPRAEATIEGPSEALAAGSKVSLTAGAHCAKTRSLR